MILIADELINITKISDVHNNDDSNDNILNDIIYVKNDI